MEGTCGGDGQVYGTDCADDFTDVYSSTGSCGCTH